MKNFVEPFEIFSQKEISLYFFFFLIIFLILGGTATRNLKNMFNAKQHFPIFVYANYLKKLL